jgi:hypothetical protein
LKKLIVTICGLLLLCAQAVAGDAAAKPAINPAPISNLRLNVLEHAPSLADFEGMAPRGEALAMTRADGFVDAEPADGTPVSQRTEAYLGYDTKNLYVVFLCFDDPRQVRASMGRRESVFSDDSVEVTLDTFRDQQRGFLFWLNPLGIQADALWSEGRESGGPDWSFDTVWRSEGKRTEQGYMALFAIPFRSLRFGSDPEQSWGITLLRTIQRNNEWAYWPRVSSQVRGRLNQAGTISGMKEVSPGRNLQFIPYGIMRSYRSLDERGTTPRFGGETIAGDIGLDAKMVIKDSFVLDATVNPDFSQIESDEPQNTVNQRFEVNFPEKRPFFLENSNFFSTPFGLNFTRRIIDPNYGVRLTGRTGRYAIGALFADDSSPGKSVLRSDPLAGKNAKFGLLRVNRDIFDQSSVGIIYADREFENESNRVGGGDFSLKFGKIWNAHGQALASSTRNQDGSYQAGPAFTSFIAREGRNLRLNLRYTDVSPGFVTETGYFQRPDIRRIGAVGGYSWRPEGKALQRVQYVYHSVSLWDKSGRALDSLHENIVEMGLTRNSYIGSALGMQRETLRPVDFADLNMPHEYNTDYYDFYAGTEFWKQVSLNAEMYWGQGINFVPVAGPPLQARKHGGNVGMTIRPLDKLQITNSYLLYRQWDGVTNANVFNSHILRSKWNYQINKELSVRLIGQYEALLTNPLNTYLESSKRFNADFLITYYLSPGTAFYAGYNSNLSTTDPSLTSTASGYLQTRDRFINDGRVVFIKMSYLFRM